MKQTVPLHVRGNLHLAENRMNIHPNEGFDIGMMTTHYSVVLEGSGPTEVWLLNECPRETLEIHPNLWKKLGNPDQVLLAYDGTTLFCKVL